MLRTESHCVVEQDGPVLTVTLNRPEARNALSPRMIVEMVEAWTRINEDESVRVAILTGAAGTFSAGADLKTMGREREGEERYLKRMEDDPDLTQKALLHLMRLDKPLIAAVEGFAVGGGTEILQATDIRIAAEDARFGLPEVRWGLFPLAGSTVRLRRQIPYTHAAELLLTGSIISAQQALAVGLIGRTVPPGTALAAARDVAARVVANGPLAVSAVKRALVETEGMTEQDAIPAALAIGRPVFKTRDAYEGTAAFAEKRTPSFEGR